MLLFKVANIFSMYPFYRGKNDVEILDGKYEGIYSWVTLNYAKGKMIMNLY